MSFDAILNEVEQLHGVSTRLEGQHMAVTDQLLTKAANVRTSATVLAELVAAKLQGCDGH